MNKGFTQSFQMSKQMLKIFEAFYIEVWMKTIWQGNLYVNPQQLNTMYAEFKKEKDQEVDYELFLYTLFENLEDEAYTDFTNFFQY